MSRIQSNVGLITGVPILDTVDQLMAISAQPRDRLRTRLQGFQQQQVAVNDIMASVIALRVAAQKFSSTAIFAAKDVTSSDTTLLSVSKTGDPPTGSYQFTPVRQASSHQFLSSGFAGLDEPIGAGVFEFGPAAYVDRGASLSDLNNGDGVQRGKIKISDRDGGSATVDLRFARTIDDVVDAINTASGVDVRAEVSGDAIKLIDNTSGAGSLKVDEVGLGTTAADLGLAAINTTSAEATGASLVSLFDDYALSELNDRNGVVFNDSLDDIRIDLADGTQLDVDFDDFSSPAKQAVATTSAQNGANSAVTFTAVSTGAEYDDVTIRFVDDGSVTQGAETVTYDDSDPDNKTLTFGIEAGSTTATDIVNALSADPTASGLFTAQAGGDGAGVIATTDIGVTSGGAAVAAPSNPGIGDLLRILNEVDPAKLEARISNDGLRIELEDKTSGGGTFAVSSLFGGSTAEDLGLTTAAAAGVITGERVVGGLKSSLLRTLNGGQGLDALGVLSITDRNGVSANVDLSGSETLSDIVTAINAAGVDVTARINDARNGLLLEDTSGGNGAFIVANGDATNTADQLQLTANGSVSEVNSGSLDLQTVTEATTLDSLNGGEGVGKGSFNITDTNGQIASLSFAIKEPKTIGDVIDEINDLGIGVEAKLNDAGDGIAIVDTVGGSGKITIEDNGTGSTAAKLQLAGESTSKTLDGQPTQVIEGSTKVRIEIDSDDTLQDLIDRINESAGNVSASFINEGAGSKPFRFSLVSSITGSAGEIQVDYSGADFELDEVVQGRDALLLLGSGANGSAGILAASSSNTFDSVLEGVSLTVEGESDSAVEISVETTDADLIRDAELFVGQYNSLVDKLESYTFFNEIDQSTGVLFGTSEALRVETAISELATGRSFGAGAINSLAELGFNIDDEGKLSLDDEQLSKRFEADPEAVEAYFTTETAGFAKRAEDVLNRLSGEGNSLLLSRSNSLQDKIDVGNERISLLNDRLDAERERLLKTFFDMETAIAKMQNNLSAISAIQGTGTATA